MLLKKHRTTLGGDILPVQRVDILALGSFGVLTPFPLLEIIDLSGGVLANAWFISIWQITTNFPFSFLDQGCGRPHPQHLRLMKLPAVLPLPLVESSPPV